MPVKNSTVKLVTCSFMNYAVTATDLTQFIRNIKLRGPTRILRGETAVTQAGRDFLALEQLASRAGHTRT